MGIRKLLSRTIAMLLALVMVLSASPLSAVGAEIFGDYYVTAFERIDDVFYFEETEMTADKFVTEYLPETLDATDIEGVERSIRVTWDTQVSEEEITEFTVYLYRAILPENCVLMPGVKSPEIALVIYHDGTQSVGLPEAEDKAIVLVSFDPFDNRFSFGEGDVTISEIEDAYLPGALYAADSEGGKHEIAVDWYLADADDRDEALVMTFRVILPEGYLFAEDVETPFVEITVLYEKAYGAGIRSQAAVRGEPDTSWYDSNPSAQSYTLGTAEELMGLAELVNRAASPVSFSGKTISLDADIDLAGINWVPIGGYSANPFRGTFNGNKHTISNLTINYDKDRNNNGFFGYTAGAVIQDLTISDAVIHVERMSVDVEHSAGALAGRVSGGSITNCHAKNLKISAYSNFPYSGYTLGGLVGYIENNHTITGSSAEGSINLTSGPGGRGGGLVGSIESSKAIGCFAEVEIDNVSNWSGGFAGFAGGTGLEITDCYAAGSVKGSYDVGGFVGYVYQYGIFTNCYALGAVEGSSGRLTAGGFAGAVYNSGSNAIKFKNCAALNPSVTRTTASGSMGGRFIGSSEKIMNGDGVVVTREGNIAWDGMQALGAYSAFPAENYLNDVLYNATGKTTSELQTAAGFPAGFDTGRWIYQEGMLPGLGGSALTMPPHLALGDAANYITGFSIDGRNGAINHNTGTISITIPFNRSTDRTPQITHTGASITPTGAQNFNDPNNPVTYTVKAANGTERTYTVKTSYLYEVNLLNGYDSEINSSDEIHSNGVQSIIYFENLPTRERSRYYEPGATVTILVGFRGAYTVLYQRFILSSAKLGIEEIPYSPYGRYDFNPEMNMREIGGSFNTDNHITRYVITMPAHDIDDIKGEITTERPAVPDAYKFTVETPAEPGWKIEAAVASVPGANNSDTGPAAVMAAIENGTLVFAPYTAPLDIPGWPDWSNSVMAIRVKSLPDRYGNYEVKWTMDGRSQSSLNITNAALDCGEAVFYIPASGNPANITFSLTGTDLITYKAVFPPDENQGFSSTFHWPARTIHEPGNADGRWGLFPEGWVSIKDGRVTAVSDPLWGTVGDNKAMIPQDAPVFFADNAQSYPLDRDAETTRPLLRHDGIIRSLSRHEGAWCYDIGARGDIEIGFIGSYRWFSHAVIYGAENGAPVYESDKGYVYLDYIDYGGALARPDVLIYARQTNTAYYAEKIEVYERLINPVSGAVSVGAKLADIPINYNDSGIKENAYEVSVRWNPYEVFGVGSDKIGDYFFMPVYRERQKNALTVKLTDDSYDADLILFSSGNIVYKESSDEHLENNGWFRKTDGSVSTMKYPSNMKSQIQVNSLNNLYGLEIVSVKDSFGRDYTGYCELLASSDIATYNAGSLCYFLNFVLPPENLYANGDEITVTLRFVPVYRHPRISLTKADAPDIKLIETLTFEGDSLEQLFKTGADWELMPEPYKNAERYGGSELYSSFELTLSGGGLNKTLSLDRSEINMTYKDLGNRRGEITISNAAELIEKFDIDYDQLQSAGRNTRLDLRLSTLVPTYYVQKNDSFNVSWPISFNKYLRSQPFGIILIDRWGGGGSYQTSLVVDDTLEGARNEAKNERPQFSEEFLAIIGDLVWSDTESNGNQEVWYITGGTAGIGNLNCGIDDADSGSRLKITRFSNHRIEIEGKRVSISLPGISMGTHDFTIEINNNVSYDLNSYRPREGSGAQNLLLRWGVGSITDSAGFEIATMLGADVDVGGFHLLKNRVTFFGSASFTLPIPNAEELAGLDLRRMEFGSSSGDYSLQGMEIEGSINATPKSLGLPNFLDVENMGLQGYVMLDTFAPAFEIDVALNISVISFEGTLILVPHNGYVIPDTLKVYLSSDNGIDIIPAVPVASLNGLGGGIQGLGDTIKGNFNYVPPALLSMRAQMRMLKIFQMDTEITVGPSMVKFSGLPSVEIPGGLSFKPFTKYEYGIQVSSDSVKIFADAELNILDVLIGKGSVSVTGVVRPKVAVSMSGSLSGKVQIPKGWWGGPYKVAGASLNISETRVKATVGIGPKILGWQLKLGVTYNWGSGSVSISTASIQTDAGYTMRMTDDQGNYAGQVVIGENTRTTARRGQIMRGGNTLFSPARADEEPWVVTLTSGNEVIILGLPCDAFELEKQNGVSWDNAELVWAEINPDGSYNDEAPNAGNVNAADMSGGTATQWSDENGNQVMLMPGAGTYRIVLKPEFAERYRDYKGETIAIDPLPELENVNYNGGQVSFSAANLAPGKEYMVEAYLGIDDELTARVAVSDVFTGSSPVSGLAINAADFPVNLPSGSYRLYLSLRENTGETITINGAGDSSTPIIQRDFAVVDTKPATMTGGPINHTNNKTPVFPGSHGLTVTSPGNGAFNVAYNKATANSDTSGVHYLIEVFDENGYQVMVDSDDAGDDGETINLNRRPLQYFIEASQFSGTAVSLSLEGLIPDQIYSLRVTPLVYLNPDGQIITGEYQVWEGQPLFGEPINSVKTRLTAEAPPILNFAPLNGVLQTNDSGERVVTGYENLRFIVEADGNVSFTAYLNGDKDNPMTADTVTGRSAEYTVNLDENRPIQSVVVTAVSAAGNSSSVSFYFHYDDNPMPLFVETPDKTELLLPGDTDPAMTQYIGAPDGTFSVTGFTRHFASVTLNLSEENGVPAGETISVRADAEGRFEFTGLTMPSGIDRLIATVAAQDISRAAFDASSTRSSAIMDVLVERTGGGGTTVTNITSVEVDVTAPVTGAAAQSAITAGTGWTGAVTWYNVTDGMAHTGNFAASKVYRADIVLTSAAGYQFTTVQAGGVTGTNGTVGTPVTTGTGTGNTLTFTVTYPQTAAAVSVIPKSVIIGTTAPATGNSINNGTNMITNASGPVITWSDNNGSAWTFSGTFAANTVYQTKYVYTANSGYKFDNTITASDITVTNGGTAVVTVSGTNDNTLTITITWPAASTATYVVTSITVSGMGGAATITANGGTLQMLADVQPSNATIKTVTWTITSGNSYANINNSGLLTATGNGSVTVKATANDGSGKFGETIINISGQSSGSTGGNGGDGGNGNNSGNGGNTSGNTGGSTTTPGSTTTITGNVNGEKVNITQNNETGTVSAAVTAADAQKAVETAKTTGEVTITIPKGDTITAQTPVEATVSKEAFAMIADSGAVLKLDTPAVIITFDAGAVGTIASAGAGDVTISAGLATTLNTEQKKIAGDRPVYDFTVTVGDKTVSEFGGDVTVSLPYTLKPGENPNAIIICYLDADGTVKTIPGGVYDATTGKVMFVTDHFSLYMIGYNAKTFADVGGHWAKDYITFVAAREIFNGTGNSQFTPNGSMTRAMFAMALANLDGVDLSGYKTSRFGDVAAGQWYAAAVEWAADKGIVSGYDGRFDPNASITREQMAVMLYNYMKYKGYAMPSGSAAAFADETAISSWALEAVKAVQKMGIVSGKPGNLYDPQGVATRAEVATIFARFVENVAGVSSMGNKTAANNTADTNSMLAMLPGKEDEFALIDDESDV